MTPYYEDESVRIYHGDCRELLPLLSLSGVVITDPPYSQHVHANGMRGARDASGSIFGEVKDFGFGSIEDIGVYSQAFARISVRWCLVFSDIETSPAWRAALCAEGLEYIRTGAWVKIAPTPQFSGDRPAAGFEAITIAHPKGKKQWNGGGKAAVWRYCAHGGARDTRYHPAQKPLELMTDLIALFSNAGELVVDPFMGSGTTLRAAKDLSRTAIGFDIEERYCEIAAKRMGQEMLAL